MRNSLKKHLTLEETVTALSATVQKIKETVESGGTVVPEPEPTPQEEYPAWEPYNGIPPVKYQVGSKVSATGKNGNLWLRIMFGIREHLALVILSGKKSCSKLKLHIV